MAGRASLLAALRAAPEGRWPEVRALVEDLLGQADYLRPFELLSRILVRHDGRRRLVARLGPEAEDGIDALIDQALAYESVEAPSLTGFLAWFDQAEVAVKRRMEEEADQVRVMTVHGAKGLEAPIVILPDTAVRYDGQNPPQVLRLADGQPAWRVRTDEAPPAVAAAESRAAGAGPRREPPAALRRADPRPLVADRRRRRGRGRQRRELARPGAGGDRRPPARGHAEPRRRDLERFAELGSRPASAAEASATEPAALPDWTRRPARVPAGAPPPLSPSGLGGAHVLGGDPTGLLTEEEAKARGTALHRLLEHLHGRPAADRPTIAARLLPGAADLPALLAEAAAVLDAPGARLRLRAGEPRRGRRRGHAARARRRRACSAGSTG